MSMQVARKSRSSIKDDTFWEYKKENEKGRTFFKYQAHTYDNI